MKATAPSTHSVRQDHAELTLPEAVHVKSAELWLKLGQPTQALMELQKLPGSCLTHPWVTKVMRKAFRTAGGIYSLF